MYQELCVRRLLRRALWRRLGLAGLQREQTARSPNQRTASGAKGRAVLGRSSNGRWLRIDVRFSPPSPIAGASGMLRRPGAQRGILARSHGRPAAPWPKTSVGQALSAVAVDALPRGKPTLATALMRSALAHARTRAGGRQGRGRHGKARPAARDEFQVTVEAVVLPPSGSRTSAPTTSFPTVQMTTRSPCPAPSHCVNRARADRPLHPAPLLSDALQSPRHLHGCIGTSKSP